MPVLIVKTSSMGDILHTLPALTDAMRIQPDIRFDWVVEDAFAQMPSWHPAVERVIPCAIRRWRRNWLSAVNRRAREAFTHALQAQKYHAIIDAQGLLKSAALVTRLARGERHGLDYKSAREAPASWFYHYRHAVNPQMHAVERMRTLFAESLGYTVPAGRGDYMIAMRFAHFADTHGARYLVFLHATTRDEKHWPESHWRELIERVGTLDYQVRLPWGASHEHERALRLAEGFPHAQVLPKLNLEKVAIELAGATAVVSVDTGLSHLAAALGKPNFTLYGPTDPSQTGGYGRNQYVCRPAGSQRLEDLSPNQVFTQLSAILCNPWD